MGALAATATAAGDLAGNYPNPTLKNTGTAGTYTKVTTDSAGRVTSGATLLTSDLPGGGYPVTSVNGQTGTVSLVCGVSSVNGFTGAVSLNLGSAAYANGINATRSFITTLSPSYQTIQYKDWSGANQSATLLTAMGFSSYNCSFSRVLTA